MWHVLTTARYGLQGKQQRGCSSLDTTKRADRRDQSRSRRVLCIKAIVSRSLLDMTVREQHHRPHHWYFYYRFSLKNSLAVTQLDYVPKQRINSDIKIQNDLSRVLLADTYSHYEKLFGMAQHDTANLETAVKLYDDTFQVYWAARFNLVWSFWPCSNWDAAVGCLAQMGGYHCWLGVSGEHPKYPSEKA